MRNKGDFTLAETMKIVLAVISIGLLLYLAVNLYGIFTKKSQIEQARETLKQIVENINLLEEGKSKTFLLESPDKWGLFYYDDVNSAKEYEDKFNLFYYFDGMNYKNAELECSKNCLCIMPFKETEASGSTLPGGTFSGITRGTRNAKVKEGVCKSFDNPILVSDDIKKILTINIRSIEVSKQGGVINIK